MKLTCAGMMDILLNVRNTVQSGWLYELDIKLQLDKQLSTHTSTVSCGGHCQAKMTSSSDGGGDDDFSSEYLRGTKFNYCTAMAMLYFTVMFLQCDI